MARRARSQEQGRPYVYQPFCWECGQLDHYSRACPQAGPVYTPPATGNYGRLEDGAQIQPAPPGLHSR